MQLSCTTCFRPTVRLYQPHGDGRWWFSLDPTSAFSLYFGFSTFLGFHEIVAFLATFEPGLAGERFSCTRTSSTELLPPKKIPWGRLSVFSFRWKQLSTGSQVFSRTPLFPGTATL